MKCNYHMIDHLTDYCRLDYFFILLLYTHLTYVYDNSLPIIGRLSQYELSYYKVIWISYSLIFFGDLFCSHWQYPCNSLLENLDDKLPSSFALEQYDKEIQLSESFFFSFLRIFSKGFSYIPRSVFVAINLISDDWD